MRAGTAYDGQSRCLTLVRAAGGDLTWWRKLKVEGGGPRRRAAQSSSVPYFAFISRLV